MVDAPEFDRWRADAAQMLESARVNDEAGLHNMTCFAAEQAAQLAVKGLLHGIGAAPWGHDLNQLRDGLQRAGVPVTDELADLLRRLSRYYIATRYPDAHASGPAAAGYGSGDGAFALSAAEAVLAFVDDAWRALGG